MPSARQIARGADRHVRREGFGDEVDTFSVDVITEGPEGVLGDLRGIPSAHPVCEIGHARVDLGACSAEFERMTGNPLAIRATDIQRTIDGAKPAPLALSRRRQVGTDQPAQIDFRVVARFVVQQKRQVDDTRAALAQSQGHLHEFGDGAELVAALDKARRLGCFVRHHPSDTRQKRREGLGQLL